MKNYESLVAALDDLRKRGYAADFATDTICLYCGDLDLRLDPEDFHVDEVTGLREISVLMIVLFCTLSLLQPG